MAQKRMVLEIGMGTDIRGADPTKAACRALRDALWHNSLSTANERYQFDSRLVFRVKPTTARFSIPSTSGWDLDSWPCPLKHAPVSHNPPTHPVCGNVVRTLESEH
jgi:GxGxDxHG motif protein